MKTSHDLCIGVAGAAFGVMLAASAYAQPPVGMQSVCKTLPCIYDSQNTLVGVPWPLELLTRQISGSWYQLKAIEGGLIESGLFYFGPTDCTGQPYNADPGDMPRFAQFDGRSIWAPVGALETFTWASYSYPALPANGGSCYQYGRCANGQPCTATGAPAVKVETRTFYPPFKVQ